MIHAGRVPITGSSLLLVTCPEHNAAASDMIVIAQVRLTSHFLGELKPDHRGVRRFRMDGKGRVFVNQNQWLEDLLFAARTMKLDIKVQSTIVPPEGLLPASIHLHKRTYSGAHVEFFESFRKGTILTFDMLVHEDRPKCPTVPQLGSLLELVGEYRGISQWGSKFGFGRFAVVGIKDRYQALSEPTPDGSAGSLSAAVSNGDSVVYDAPPADPNAA